MFKFLLNRNCLFVLCFNLAFFLDRNRFTRWFHFNRSFLKKHNFLFLFHHLLLHHLNFLLHNFLFFLKFLVFLPNTLFFCNLSLPYSCSCCNLSFCFFNFIGYFNFWWFFFLFNWFGFFLSSFDRHFFCLFLYLFSFLFLFFYDCLDFLCKLLRHFLFHFNFHLNFLYFFSICFSFFNNDLSLLLCKFSFLAYTNFFIILRICINFLFFWFLRSIFIIFLLCLFGNTLLFILILF